MRYHISLISDSITRTREEMLADLEASDAEVEAGLTVPGEVVMQTIQAAIDRLEERLASARQRKTASHG